MFYAVSAIFQLAYITAATMVYNDVIYIQTVCSINGISGGKWLFTVWQVRLHPRTVLSSYPDILKFFSHQNYTPRRSALCPGIQKMIFLQKKCIFKIWPIWSHPRTRMRSQWFLIFPFFAHHYHKRQNRSGGLHGGGG